MHIGGRRMGDLISRQAAISDFEWCKSQAIDKDRWQEAIDRIKALPSAEEESFEWCTDCKEYDQEKHCCHRWTKVIRNTVEEIRNEQRWIPVSERLPDKSGKYLVSVTNGNVYAGTFDAYSGCFQCAAAAWQPLPEPYKDGDVK